MPTPPIVHHVEPVLSAYDAVFCDVWGVVHNGHTAYRDGCEALRRFRAGGGTVILLTNAPRRPAAVSRILDEKNVPENCWDAIVSSGGLAVAHAIERGLAKVHHIGPERDLDVFDDTDLTRVALDDADCMFCTGLIDDRTETAEDYRPLLTRALEKRLPLVCANPDLVVDVGGALLLCAGSIAAIYEAMGGDVYWAGKPYRPAYDAAFRRVAERRGAALPKSRILAIGDAVRTDIAGACAFGIDALFIGQGIHRDDIMPDGMFEKDALTSLFAATGDDSGTPVRPTAIAAMTGLAW